jgi:hypothetical protein
MDAFGNDWSIWKTLVWGSLWTPVLVLVHELAHAALALWLTRGPVLVSFGRRRRWAVRAGRLVLAVSALAPAFCAYDARQLRGSRRSQIWIAAAGPLGSLLSAVGLALLAGGAAGSARGILAVGALYAAVITIGSGLPMRYGRGLGLGGDSDGMVIWRILTGGTSRRAREARDVAIARPGFLVVLALILVLAFATRPELGLAVMVVFGWALFTQTRASD